jgi:hypothetical protein
MVACILEQFYLRRSRIMENGDYRMEIGKIKKICVVGCRNHGAPDCPPMRRPQLHVHLIDNSKEALANAEENIRKVLEESWLMKN